MKATPYPNFFIIGAPKCGTTALAHYLSSHPQIYITPLKEPEFFATDFPGRLVKSLANYLSLFDDADPTIHRAIGEASTIYLCSTDAVSNILEFQPDAKIIVMLRNPVDLVVSLHRQLLKVGNENITDFLEAWDAEKERRTGKRIPPFCREPKFLYYSEYGKLGTQLKRVMDIVPKGQLKIIVFDDFVNNTRTIYQETLAFLGLADDGRNEFPRINEARVPRSQIIQIFLRFLLSIWLPVRAHILKGKSLGFGRWLEKYITRPPNKDARMHASTKWLSKYYRNEIFRLEELLGRSLEHWR